MTSDPRDLRAPRVNRVSRVSKAPRDLQERRDLRVIRGPLDSAAHPDRKASRVLTDLRVSRETRASAT